MEGGGGVEDDGAPDAIRSPGGRGEGEGERGGRDISQVGGPIRLKLPNDDWTEMTRAVIGCRRGG